MLFDNDYVLWLRCIYQALVEQNNTRHSISSLIKQREKS